RTPSTPSAPCGPGTPRKPAPGLGQGSSFTPSWDSSAAPSPAVAPSPLSPGSVESPDSSARAMVLAPSNMSRPGRSAAAYQPNGGGGSLTGCSGAGRAAGKGGRGAGAVPRRVDGRTGDPTIAPSRARRP